MKTLYAVRKVGNVRKRTRYVPNVSNPGAPKKTEKRDKEQRKRDKFREKVDRLGLLIAGNFDMKKDKSVVLSIPGAKLEALRTKAKKDGITYYLSASNDLSCFLKSFQRKMRADNLPFKCIGITSQRSRQGGRTRLHYHLIVNAEAVPYLIEAWKEWVNKAGATKVIVRTKTLYEDAGKGKGAYALAGYLLAQVTGYKNKNSYFSSRSLERPVIIYKGTVTGGFRLKAPAGAEILRVSGGGGNPTASVTYRVKKKNK